MEALDAREHPDDDRDPEIGPHLREQLVDAHRVSAGADVVEQDRELILTEARC